MKELFIAVLLLTVEKNHNKLIWEEPEYLIETPQCQKLSKVGDLTCCRSACCQTANAVSRQDDFSQFLQQSVVSIHGKLETTHSEHLNCNGEIFYVLTVPVQVTVQHD